MEGRDRSAEMVPDQRPVRPPRRIPAGHAVRGTALLAMPDPLRSGLAAAVLKIDEAIAVTCADTQSIQSLRNTFGMLKQRTLHAAPGLSRRRMAGICGDLLGDDIHGGAVALAVIGAPLNSRSS